MVIYGFSVGREVAKAAWTHFLMLPWSKLHIMIVLALVNKWLLPFAEEDPGSFCYEKYNGLDFEQHRSH